MAARSLPRWTRKFEIIRWIGILLLALFVLVPVIAMLVGSLSPTSDLYRTPPQILPTSLTLNGYIEAFEGSGISQWFINSVIVAGVTTVLNAVIGVTGAYATIRFNFPGRTVLVVGMLASYLFPAILLILPLAQVVQGVGLGGTLAALIVAHCAITVPFSVWLMRAFIVKIPAELEEAARIDGGNAWQVFVKITLPLAKGGLIATSTFAFILSWNEYLFSSVLSNGATATIPVGIAGYVTGFDVRIGAILAVGSLATIPVLVIFAIFQRYVERGMLESAVKG